MFGDQPACPKCRLYHGPTEHCDYDALTAALVGVKLTAREEKLLVWLAGWDGETCMDLVGLFARLAAAANARDIAGRRADAERAAVIVSEAYRNAHTLSATGVAKAARALRDLHADGSAAAGGAHG